MKEEDVASRNKRDIIETIIKFNNDPEVRQLQSFYYNQTVPEILGVSRREVSHSAFLAWLFNPDANHGLGQKPLIRLLERYLRCYRDQGKEYIDNVEKLPTTIQTAILTHNISVISTTVKTEESVAVNKARGRADIVITCDVRVPNSNIQRLSIIIENKIYSKEHQGQTQRYFDYHQKSRLCDENGNYLECCLYIYLTPSTIKDDAKCSSFVHLTYQHLLDDVLERILIQSDINERTRFILTEYVNNLSLPADYIDETNNTKKEKIIMAISEQERELLRSFWGKYKELFTAALTAMQSDTNASDDEKDDIAKTLASVNNLMGKKYYRYKINGKGTYACGQVVVKLIEMYLLTYPQASLNNINDKFAKFAKPIAATLEEAQRINNKPNSKGRCIKRYFADLPITLNDNTQIAITNQWGNDDKFEKLIEFAESLILNCKVERVE